METSPRGGTGSASGGASSAGWGAAGGAGVGGDSSAPSDLAQCPAYQEGNDFLVCRAGYVSSEQDPDSGGVAVLPSGQIIVGGSLSAPLLGDESAEFLVGGAAGVALLSASGKTVMGSARLGDRVSDVASGGPDGRVAVVGDFGLAVLDSELKSLLFSSALGSPGTRVSVG